VYIFSVALCRKNEAARRPGNTERTNGFRSESCCGMVTKLGLKAFIEHYAIDSLSVFVFRTRFHSCLSRVVGSTIVGRLHIGLLTVHYITSLKVLRLVFLVVFVHALLVENFSVVFLFFSVKDSFATVHVQIQQGRQGEGP